MVDYKINKLEVIQIPKKQLSEHLINELKGREAFIDTDDTLEEVIYYGDVFEAILCEQHEYFEKLNLVSVGTENQKLVDELSNLNELCKNSQYIMITIF